MSSPIIARLKHEDGLREPPIWQVARPFQTFFRIEATSGLVLVACVLAAVLWANSPWAHVYAQLWETEVALDLGPLRLSMPLLHWINEGLMTVFFFVVGLEIKREMLIGELSTIRRATLPLAAALGGMLVPALLYLAINRGTPGEPGWGIPMATDIAFALGVLALLGRRAPVGLKVFLAALAIVDDLGAVLVIALFYTAEIHAPWLAAAAAVFAAMLLANRMGTRHPVPYGLLGIALWLALLQSGVHATIAGVLAAMTIPAKARIDTDQFVRWGRRVMDEFEAALAAPEAGRRRRPTTAHQRSLLQALESAIHQAEAPLQRLEHAMDWPNAYVVVPVFALANAGIALTGDYFQRITEPVSLGVLLGLVVGKQVGIGLFAWLAVRLGLSRLPKGVRWRHVYGAAWLGGIGFTMSLFISGLAFQSTAMLDNAKIAILTASMVSAAVGYLILRTAAVHRAAESLDDEDPEVPRQPSLTG